MQLIYPQVVPTTGMAEKVPLPGTGLELDTGDGVTGNVSTFAKGSIGVAAAVTMFALGFALFRGAAGAAGQDTEVEIPIA